ncbi:hypothetical protein FQN57_006274 [Myotisia sp. PD_48]|nr:hypothetical protein FQN57_006274 [Myotisia sp. PD_48]
MEHPSLLQFEVEPHLAKYNVPMKDFAASHPEYSCFVTGAHIFSTGRTDEFYNLNRCSSLPHVSSSPKIGPMVGETNTQSQQPRVLLLQRSLTDSYPGYWEGPGGSCESTDLTLLESLAREVREESGLHVSRVQELVGIETWDRNEGKDPRPNEIPVLVARFLFLVDVHEANPLRYSGDFDFSGAGGWEHAIQMAPEEHTQYMWVTEDHFKIWHEEEQRDGEKNMFAGDIQHYFKTFQLINSRR